MGAPAAEQLSLPDLDGATEISLRETTFVVVDLETTGGRMTARDGKVADAITEIGAVKVRGGVVLGEFATLVDPQRSIPPQIVQLTGITTAMGCDAPTIAAVLPMVLEFAGGAVMVAHNARFDMGFLRAAADQCGIRWSRPQTLCTVQLARRVLSREEAPSVRLGALARVVAVASGPPSRCCTRSSNESATRACTAMPSCGPTCPMCHRRSGANECSPRACRAGPGCTCFAARPTRCCTSVPQLICGAG